MKKAGVPKPVSFVFSGNFFGPEIRWPTNSDLVHRHILLGIDSVACQQPGLGDGMNALGG